MIRRMTARFVGNDRERGSFMLVFLVLLVVGGLTALALTTAIGAQSSTRHDQHYTQALPAADKQIQQALLELNSNNANLLPTSPVNASGGSVSTTINGTTGCPAATSWYTTKDSATQYRVWSTDTVTKTTRCVHGVLQQGRRYAFAAYANTSVTFRGANSADSYNHRTGQNGTGDGDVGTDGSLTFNGNASADGVTLYNWNANPDPNRCSGNPCSNLVTVGSNLDIQSPASTAFITGQMQALCSGASAWVSSAHGGVLPAGSQCYSSLNFDQDTTIAGSVSGSCDPSAAGYNPTIVYVQGNLSGANHININYSGGFPNACALQIFVMGSSVSLGNHTSFGGVIYAPFASCGGNPSNAQADIYGAMVCDTITNQGGWGFHYDDALADIGDGTWGLYHYAEE